MAVLLTPVVRWAAIRHQWVARPKEDRWHKNTTALMGGIAIYIAVAVPFFYASDFLSIWDHVAQNSPSTQPASLPAVLFIGATFLFLLGLFDDFRNIKPHSKLIGQILAASMVAFLGYRLTWFHSLTLDTMATLFWIVGITNAFNLIDNMDGLCAGVGTVAAVSLAFIYAGALAEAFQVSLIISGALAGFLIYNFNPARIFMGDCGSLVIGFTISVLALFFDQTASASPLASVAVPILVLLVPILDTSLVTVIRILSGRKASIGGRDHTSHRLVLLGFSERKAVLLLYLVGAVSGLAAVYVSTSDTLSSSRRYHSGGHCHCFDGRLLVAAQGLSGKGIFAASGSQLYAGADGVDLQAAHVAGAPGFCPGGVCLLPVLPAEIRWPPIFLLFPDIFKIIAHFDRLQNHRVLFDGHLQGVVGASSAQTMFFSMCGLPWWPACLPLRQ